MKNILAFLMIIFTITTIITGCAEQEEQSESSSFQTDEAYENTSELDSRDEYTLLEQNDRYVIYCRSTGLDRYKTEIFDISGNLIDTVHTRHEPKFVETTYNGDEVIGIWDQAGTGISTRYIVYYNLTTGDVSNQFVSYFDTCGEKVAVGNVGSVVVQDIFDSGKYYKEISDFSDVVYTSIIDNINAEFSSDGSQIAVTYYVSLSETKTEIFDLN